MEMLKRGGWIQVILEGGMTRLMGKMWQWKIKGRGMQVASGLWLQYEAKGMADVGREMIPGFHEMEEMLC